MTHPFRVAATLPPGPCDVGATVEHAVWAEDVGYDDVWFADGGDADALTLSAAVGIRTERVRIGVAVVPVYTRTPPLLAATALALDGVTNHRFVLGLGSSSHAMMEGWHGQKLDKPLTRVRETAQLVRQALSGARTDFGGQTVRSHGYRQARADVPIYLAGLRAGMLEMAAEVGDGVVINLFPEGALSKMMDHVAIGAARAGKALEDVEIVSRHQVCVTDDPESARAQFRQKFAPYYATPVYNRFLAWAGYDAVAEAITAGWTARDRAATTGAIADALIDEIAIIGSEAYCQDRIRRYANAGIHTHIIACTSEDPEDMRRTYAAFQKSAFSFG